jgi:hypothetical protein
MNTRPERDPQQTAQCVYSIPWMRQKQHWRNRQTSGHAAPWT